MRGSPLREAFTRVVRLSGSSAEGTSGQEHCLLRPAYRHVLKWTQTRPTGLQAWH